MAEAGQDGPAGGLADFLAVADSRADGPPFDPLIVIGAVLLTIFFPMIALVVALVLHGGEVIWSRRQFLRNWAIASAAWLCTGWLIGLVVLVTIGSAVSGPSGCKGGIDQLTPPTYTSADGKHWTVTYTCMNGGTTERSVPASQVPGGG
jgi:hypothetical protein